MASAVRQVKLNRNHRVPFDRLNPEPPRYLNQLRTVGHWRRWKHAGTKREMSRALRNADESSFCLPDDRGCFLDAGCGHSSDAYFAMKRWGFKEGLKVDLFPPYPDSPYFLERMNEFECHKTRFIQGDICKLTGFVPADSVDMIGCSAVLDLMDTPDRNLFYSEAYDVLRPGGVLTVYYTGLVYGHNDWGNGCQDMENATTLGFEWLDGSPVHMILHKPLAKEDAKDKEGEGRG